MLLKKILSIIVIGFMCSSWVRIAYKQSILLTSEWTNMVYWFSGMLVRLSSSWLSVRCEFCQVVSSVRWWVLSGGEFCQVMSSVSWWVLSGGEFCQVVSSGSWWVLAGGEFYQMVSSLRCSVLSGGEFCHVVSSGSSSLDRSFNLMTQFQGRLNELFSVSGSDLVDASVWVQTLI